MTVDATVSNSTSTSYPPASPQACRAFAYANWAFSDVRRGEHRAFGGPTVRRPPTAPPGPGSRRIQRGYGRPSRRPRSDVVATRVRVLRHRATDHADELSHHAEPTGARNRADRHRMSPATIRSSVVLPAPFGPTSATFAPSPTRKLTSAKSTRPSGSTCDNTGDVHVPHKQQILPVDNNMLNEDETEEKLGHDIWLGDSVRSRKPSVGFEAGLRVALYARGACTDL